MNKFNLALLLALMFLKVFTAGSQSLNNTRVDGYKGIWFELNQKYEYGDKYSGGLGTYTAHHFPMAIYVEAIDKTFFVYGGTTHEEGRHLLCMIGCFDHKTNKVEKPVVVHDKLVVDDPHDNPSLMVDHQGYLWVFVSGRSSKRPGFKYRSEKPYSIESFKEVTSEEFTYPQPWQLEGEVLHLFTKYSGVRELYYETSADGLVWSDDKQLAGIREPGHSRGGHYQVSQKTGNRVGTFFNRHPDGNVDKRTDLYYIETNDMGSSWTTIDGKQPPLPLRDVDCAARAVNYAEQGLNVYLCDMSFDSGGNPVCLYVTSRGHEPGPGNSPYQWRVTRWDGSVWVSSAIADSDHNYDMGSIIIDGDNWLVAAPIIQGPQSWGAGGEIAFYVSTDLGKTWTRKQQITHNSDRNQGYVRRVINGRDPFFVYWADGHAHLFSISKLYFADSKGNVWALPYKMDANTQEPEKIR